jgi:hypothetical protein
MSGQLLWPSSVALAQLESRRRERAWKLRPLEERSTGGDDDAKIATTDTLQRFNSLARDLSVGLCLPEAFAWRIEGNCFGLDQRRQVGQPSLGASDVITYDHKKALPQIPSECSYDHCIGRTVETANAAASAGTRQGAQQPPEFTQRFEDGEQLWERHGAS